ncbi:MAG: DUF1850 domain-containing protein [Casimicrobiaceae bacterium]
MTRPGAARVGALLLGLAVPVVAGAACIELASHPDGATLAHVAVATAAPEFTITYMHSVTRTPVEERFAIDGTTLVETQMSFALHGPGLPTAADPGGTMTIVDGRHLVSMARRYDTFVMRVHADQLPQLHVAGQVLRLTAWGNRALSLRAVAGTCPDS